ncbi:hypothetical protein C8A05DRAFT_41504 [Staphylotrichum tortipilum]|uniref:Uncharacterized protein n=1 Tax=Staphylotrichum tortipilum TaxID=2831512 RepID=A0AAN6RWH2_9PEZI|nr:hypothetical protein C8A05DRAFT_41504 [Staphylotrichum longicolle]
MGTHAEPVCRSGQQRAQLGWKPEPTFGGGGGLTDSTNSQNPFGGGGSGAAAGSGGSQNLFGGGSLAGTTLGGGGGGGSAGQSRLDEPRADGRAGIGQSSAAGCRGTNGGASVSPRVPCCRYRISFSGRAPGYLPQKRDGKLYQSPDGATFYIQCCSHGAQSVIKTLITANFGESWSNPYHTCKLSEDGGCGATNMHNYAFVVDPPTIESPDSAGALCSTKCPFAHGQLHVSSVGESFHMDCSQRHGTQVIFRDRHASLNVDYDVHGQICYYGKHQGEPTIDAPGFVSAHSLGCAGACSACSGGRCRTDPDPSAEPLDDRPFPQDGALSGPAAPELLFPALGGQIMDAGGARYRITRGVKYFGPAADQRWTLDECLQAYINTPGCNSINWLETDYHPSGVARCILRQCSPDPVVGNHIAGHKL